MSKVAIITDSTTNIPKEYLEKYNISVAPQILIWGQETLLDGVDIQPTEFYTRLAKATVMPSTSQVTPSAFHKLYTKLLDEGYDILTIVISSVLSGTMNSAIQAREMLPKAPIEIVDSRTTAMALGFIVLECARAAESGASLAECKTLAEKAIPLTGVVFAVDTLEFLHRLGRIGGAKRFLGTALNIKPILELRDGRIEALEQVRTKSKALARLAEVVYEQIGDRRPVHMATLHANAPADAKALLDQTCAKYPDLTECIFSEISPVVGANAGPGTVGLAYMAGL